ncbi:MAG: MFS transporter [Phycisphaerales bacterium]
MPDPTPPPPPPQPDPQRLAELNEPTDGPGGLVDSSGPPPAPGEPHDPYEALRSPNFVRFASGFVCSSFGLQMLATVVLFEVYDRTHDAIHLGYTGLARALPVVLLALVSGHIIDTHDRKKILVLTQFGFAAVGIGLAVCSLFHAPLWTLYVLLFCAGCVRSFNGPSRQALLPLLVEKGGFENAIKWTTGLFQFSAVTAPLVAGLLLDITKAAWVVYALMAALCLAFAISSMGLQPREQVRTAKGLSLDSMLAGLGHLRREKTVLGALLLDLFAVLLGGATALIPVYVTDVLHIDKNWAATAQGALRASLYVGALIMAIILAHRPPFRRSGALLLGCVGFFGVCMIGFGYSTSFWLSVTLLLMAGAADQVSVVIRHVLVQVRTPDDLRGRVGAVNSLFIECSNELGSYESGLTAKLFGPVTSVVGGGIGTVVVVAMIAWRIPELAGSARSVKPNPKANHHTLGRAQPVRGLLDRKSPSFHP